MYANKSYLIDADPKNLLTLLNSKSWKIHCLQLQCTV